MSHVDSAGTAVLQYIYGRDSLLSILLDCCLWAFFVSYCDTVVQSAINHNAVRSGRFLLCFSATWKQIWISSSETVPSGGRHAWAAVQGFKKPGQASEHIMQQTVQGMKTYTLVVWYARHPSEQIQLKLMCFLLMLNTSSAKVLRTVNYRVLHEWGGCSCLSTAWQASCSASSVWMIWDASRLNLWEVCWFWRCVWFWYFQVKASKRKEKNRQNWTEST